MIIINMQQSPSACPPPEASKPLKPGNCQVLYLHEHSPDAMACPVG